MTKHYDTLGIKPDATAADFDTIEMLREVVAAEIDPPHDLRAWGPITKKAMRKDVIQLVRGATAPAASSNGSPKPLYRRGVGALA